MSTKRPALILVAGALFLGACSSTTTSTPSPGTTAGTSTAPMSTSAPMGSMATKDIVDTAVAAGQFTTLAKLLTDAGLVDTLKGSGPFTVFAPTDDAFAKVPAATLDALAKDPAKLEAVLTYHVVPGKVMAADVKAGPVETVQGEDITVTTSGGGVMVNNANVVKTDVVASNGVIHVIDTVLLPPSVS